MLDVMRVSDPTRNDAWGLMLDLERQVRYYGRLADRYSLRYIGIRYFLLLGVLGEGVVLYFLSGDALLLLVVGGLGALALGFVTLFDAATNYAMTSALLRTASLLCDELNVEAQRLWRDIEAFRVPDNLAEERCNQLMDRWSRATLRVSLEIHDHDNVRAALEAYEIVSGRYAR